VGTFPSPLTRLIGRGDEVAQGRALLGDTGVRLLSVTGAPGVGKTRLALALGAECASEFADAGAFVPLAPVRDARLVASTIARGVGVGEVGGARAFERLALWLKGKEFLLVLDNFEHLVRASPLLPELLSACPALKVLVTSRVRLQVSGEHELRLAPLAVPDLAQPTDVRRMRRYASVELFCERARAVVPDFALGRQNAAAVGEICLRLDGLPLALELAAARLRLLSAEELRARLEHRLDLLTAGARDLPARQRTLRDTIDWSYQLLHESERRLFRRLGVFVGGFTLNAAEAVGASAGEQLPFLDRVAVVLDANLIRESPGAADTRLAMLETIREYALERLEQSGETSETRSAHAAFFLQLAEEAEPGLTSSHQERWLQRLEVEHANLRAALRFLLDSGRAEDALRLATALSRFWVEHGHLSEAERWLDEALAADAGSARLRARALCGAGLVAHDQGRYEQATELCREAAALSHKEGDPGGEALALSALAFVAAKEGDFDAVRALYEEAVSLCRNAGERWLLAHVLERFGTAVWMQGDNAAARACFEESLAMFRRLDDRRESAFVSALLGAVALAEGDDERELALLEAALPELREGSKPRYLAQMLLHIGQARTDSGDRVAAGDAFREVLTLMQPRGFLYGIVLVLTGVARIALGEGLWADAVGLFAAADQALDRVGGVMPIYMRRRQEEGCAQARAALGSTRFEAAVAQGRELSLDDAARLAERVAAVAARDDVLSAREREILGLVAERLSNQEIADRLVVSIRTVHAHLRSIYRKLGVNSRTDAVEQGRELHLVGPK
jgi:predicted ATPase/DNA-binding CsgD family transcriptional regulator